jgi:hypothetical protein
MISRLTLADHRDSPADDIRRVQTTIKLVASVRSPSLGIDRPGLRFRGN